MIDPSEQLRQAVLAGRVERIRRLIVAFGVEFMGGYRRA